MQVGCDALCLKEGGAYDHTARHITQLASWDLIGWFLHIVLDRLTGACLLKRSAAGPPSLRPSPPRVFSVSLLCSSSCVIRSASTDLMTVNI